jgi:hypothetical protein
LGEAGATRPTTSPADIDTAYDGAQFFVRHAYFLGADDPYDKLKRALRRWGWQVDRYDRVLSS